MHHKIILILLLNLVTSPFVFANAIEQKDLRFVPQIEQLFKGEAHYAMEIVKFGELSKKYPDFYELDSLGLIKPGKTRFALAKSAFIVDRPIGFFDHETMNDERFVSHLLGEQQVKKISKGIFKVNVPAPIDHSYTMKSYYDSDEISSLPNSKVIRAVATAKKLDVISISSASTIFREFTDYSKYSLGGIQISSFIPLNERKTLIVTYYLSAIKRNYAIETILKKNLRDESMAQKELIGNFEKFKTAK
jgi:hypothetical protein